MEQSNIRQLLAAKTPSGGPHQPVILNAMTPANLKAATGLQIRYGLHRTALGLCLLAATDQGICNLHFLDTAEADMAAAHLRAEWPHADLKHAPQLIEAMCDRIFAPAGLEPQILYVKGTPFQLQVWRALLEIPFAEVTSYSHLATAIGRPTAARAIGNAVGKNPVAYLIPCHRVVRESGTMGGYRWGLERKAALLAWEAARNSSPQSVLAALKTKGEFGAGNSGWSSTLGKDKKND